MSMPIQRQSEQYGVFDDGPRFARDRSSTDLPKGLAHLINTSGPRIQAGLLNTREAAGYDFGNGPRDHGGRGPDGGPSVPDSYYDDDNDNDGDPQDPPGTPREDPWGHHAGSRLAGDHRAPEGSERNQDGDWPGSIYQPHIQEMFDEAGIEPDGAHYRYHQDRHRYDDEHLASRRPFDRAAAGRLAACQLCGDDVLPREGDWEHVSGPSDHPAEPDDDDYDNDEYGEGLDPARGMDAYKQRREMVGHRIVAFDWKPDPERDEGDDEIWNTHTAPLENGHSLQVWQWGRQYYDDPENYPNGPGEEDLKHGSGDKWHSQIYGPDEEGLYDKWGHSSKEEAMRDAEQHYEKMFPIGTDTGGHDSGTDYSNLNSFDLNAPIDESKFSPYDPDERGPRLARNRTAADAAVMDPTQMQVPLGGGYQPAHRVGLPWRDQVIPGTVIGLDGPNVNVRWDDGQYSIEEPHNIQLL